MGGRRERGRRETLARAHNGLYSEERKYELEARNCKALRYIDTKRYYFGADDDSRNKSSSNALLVELRFDLSGPLIGPIPPPRGSMGFTAAAAGKLLLFGGYNEDGKRWKRVRVRGGLVMGDGKGTSCA